MLTKKSHAFRFLLSALRTIAEHFEANKSNTQGCELGKKTCDHSTCEAYYRILRACCGHVRWIDKNCVTDARKKKFIIKRWASGQTVDGSDTHSLLSHAVRIDTALQIIKVGEYLKLQPPGAPGAACSSTNFHMLVNNWLTNLSNAKTNNLHVYQRSTGERPARYYLTDHAIIWWAIWVSKELKATKELDFDITEQSSRPLSDSELFRRNVINRFTTENPVLKKRMLATSRTRTDTQFLLDLQDTFLFHAAERGLFNIRQGPSEKGQREKEQWENTQNCQDQHDDNDDADWVYPLQYALACILASSGKSINGRPASEMYAHAKPLLLQQSSPNGLLPSQLGTSLSGFLGIPWEHFKSTAELEANKMHDAYWSTTFEIPYILWKYQRDQQDTHDSTNIQQSSISPSSVAKEDTRMNKRMAFGYSINQNNINEMFDDWLYDVPDFFNSQGAGNPNSNEDPSEGQCAKSIKGAALNDFDTTTSIRGYISDVATVKKKQVSGTGMAEGLTSNADLCQRLRAKRTRADAKKRLLQLFQFESSTTKICEALSSEQKRMKDFFSRHGRYEKYFSEDTTPSSNKWVTELHLSFYQCLDEAAHSSPAGGFPVGQEIFFPTSKRTRNTWVRRAVISFRFSGDFFDRYWTCHFVAYSPAKPCEDVTAQFKGDDEDIWQQRKALELVLFDIILEQVVGAADGIMKEANAQVLSTLNSSSSDDDTPELVNALNLLSADNNATFLATSKLCHQIQYLLRVVQDDLDETLLRIEAWLDRENKRQPPRWTQKDERRYRHTIFHWQNPNNDKVSEVRRCREKIASYSLSLDKKLEDIRAELELQGADDIRLFTYITAVFLPVGFATGIFSMSEAPSGATFGFMIAAAVFALLLTFIALVNAKFLAAKMSPFKKACKIRFDTAELSGNLGRTVRNHFSHQAADPSENTLSDPQPLSSTPATTSTQTSLPTNSASISLPVTTLRTNKENPNMQWFRAFFYRQHDKDPQRPPV